MKLIIDISEEQYRTIRLIAGTQHWRDKLTLEQIIATGEPYDEDCIRRQAVLDTLDNMDKALDEDRTVENYKELLRECYKILTPISSSEKPNRSGHWIKEKSLHGWDGKSYQCSECGRSIHLDSEIEDLTDYPYCHCGAQMIESEE